jgi:hypothetical protein
MCLFQIIHVKSLFTCHIVGWKGFLLPKTKNVHFIHIKKLTEHINMSTYPNFTSLSDVFQQKPIKGLHSRSEPVNHLYFQSTR